MQGQSVTRLVPVGDQGEGSYVNALYWSATRSMVWQRRAKGSFLLVEPSGMPARPGLVCVLAWHLDCPIACAWVRCVVVLR
jgi:hypothetical protein